MSRIDNLIKELCPEGVPKVSLGEVCTFKRGKTITAKIACPGNIPVISGGQSPSYYHNEYNRYGETIAVAGSGAYAGFISYWDIPIYVSDAFTVDPQDDLLTKYLYYYLLNIQGQIYNLQKGAGVPHVHGKDLASIIVPFPPISVQREIISILNKFTNTISELDMMIVLREKQYEYYRNQLLFFEENECPYAPLKDIFETRNGYTPSTTNSSLWTNGTIPWFKMEDIRENGRILNDSKVHITEAAIKGKGLFKANSIIIATSATIGEHALITVPYLSNQRFTNLYPKLQYHQKINMKFYYYYMFIVDDWCKNHINQGGFASVDMEGLYKLRIPIPSMKRQRQIVSILDCFESLITELKLEKKMRQQQYEYYRDKLLTFD